MSRYRVHPHAAPANDGAGAILPLRPDEPSPWLRRYLAGLSPEDLREIRTELGCVALWAAVRAQAGR